MYTLGYIVAIYAGLGFFGDCGDSEPENSKVVSGNEITTSTSDLNANLSFDYKAFDQTMGHGWRALADVQKFREAAELIDAYLQHQKNLPDWQRRILQFHKGQMLAVVGEYKEAVVALKAALDPNEKKNPPLRWNAYVRATIAFLEKDEKTLKQMRDDIAQEPEWNGSIPNLQVVDGLINHFDKSYKEAYGGKQ